MSRWADRFPRVTVPASDVTKPLTLIYPFFCQPQFFATQLAGWAALSSFVRRHVSAIVVDDCSPEPARLPDVRPLALRLFRIEVKRRWNWLAARNIGMTHAAEGWCLLTDMDHVVPEATLRSIMLGRHDPSVVYAFARREHTGKPIDPHSATFLMTRALFWTIGGYDEALSGNYGTDGEFRRRVAQHARFEVLTDDVIRHEYIGDSSTTQYPRKRPEEAAEVQRLIAARGADWRPLTLSFPYHEVLPC